MLVRIARMSMIMLSGLCFLSQGCTAKASAKISATTAKAPEEPPPAAEPPAPEPVAQEPAKKGGFGKAAAAMRKMRARIKADRIEIDEKVHFATGKAEILPDSFPLLDDVVVVLSENPNVSCEVAGHTDNVGKANFNKRLSNDRAEAVKAYLLGKGVAAARLRAMGYGQDEPVDSNDSEDGREKNRRVEFRVVK